MVMLLPWNLIRCQSSLHRRTEEVLEVAERKSLSKPLEGLALDTVGSQTSIPVVSKRSNLKLDHVKENQLGLR